MSVFIIAEIGVNHNGDLNLAQKMILDAKKSGADAVKFQSFKADNLVVKDLKKADYQLKNTDKDESQYNMIKKLELSQDSYNYLKDFCEKEGIIFLSSPFDLESVELLSELGVEIIKIPSGEITNLPYIEKIGKLFNKIIISTGMCNLSEVKEAIEIIKKFGKKEITVLHCNTEYPTPMEDVNLRAIETMKKELNLQVGYSDHTAGIEVAIAAVTMGATVIEKHFTTDKNLDGPDHKASIEPKEFKKMVDSIRNIEKALGNGIKMPSKSELKNINIVRKSIVAKNKILKGEIFSEINLTVKRPAEGISPMDWYKVLGEIAKKDFLPDERIEL